MELSASTFSSWPHFLEKMSQLGLSERMLFVWGNLLIVFVFFYLHGWFFVLADWYGFLDKYAIRSGSHKVVAMEKQWAAIKEASFDLFIVKPVVFYSVYPIVAGKFIYFDNNLPTIRMGLLQWLGLKVVFATSLYVLHRAMHHKYIYQYVHKKHHTYHDTVGFAAQFAHPVEGIVSSMHVVFGVMLIKPHYLVFCAFLASTMVEIIDSHCGYDVPWAWLYPWSDRYYWGSGARAHDYHHSHNIGTYGGGLLGVWDRWLGTDADFRKFEERRLKELDAKVQ
jgi:sterol desaturase/sphingolipid hydroxylase (fatty acid hydroxylase superfamily)